MSEITLISICDTPFTVSGSIKAGSRSTHPDQHHNSFTTEERRQHMPPKKQRKMSNSPDAKTVENITALFTESKGKRRKMSCEFLPFDIFQQFIFINYVSLTAH